MGADRADAFLVRVAALAFAQDQEVLSPQKAYAVFGQETAG